MGTATFSHPYPPREDCWGCSGSGLDQAVASCEDSQNDEWYVYSEVSTTDGLCLPVHGEDPPDCVPAVKCEVDVYQEWQLPPGTEVRQCIDRGSPPLRCAYPPFIADGSVESDGRSQPQASSGTPVGYQVNALTPCGLLTANAQATCTQCVH